MNLIEKAIEKAVNKIISGDEDNRSHPYIGKRVICRTYSAGVHFGTLLKKEGTEVILVESARLWSWKNSGLSLSAVNINGLSGGRINATGEILLTQVIEMIPMTEKFENSWRQHVE